MDKKTIWLDDKGKLHHEGEELAHLNPFKAGDRVRYKDLDLPEPFRDRRIFTVYGVYTDKEVSLGLADYPDCEQDTMTHIDKIYLVRRPKK